MKLKYRYTFHVFLVVILSAITIYTPLQAVGQIHVRDLNGEWITPDTDSMYYKSDTIVLYQDINYYYMTDACYFVCWQINRRNFKLEHLNQCAEPGRVWSYSEPETISLLKGRSRQAIEIRSQGRVLESFYILEFTESAVDRYPYEIKSLTLLRMESHKRSDDLHNRESIPANTDIRYWYFLYLLKFI